ncbi:MAG: hypothetical protein IKB64_02240 [Paludibacteraceae bacterium]|nr:hypothetical protein [Paludibacteraceae bacterium]
MLNFDDNKTLKLEFWNRNPVKIMELQKPRKLSDQDIMALRYAAEELLTSTHLSYEGTLTRENIAQACSVCDEELYLGDFEGYNLTETAVIRSLFFNEDNRLIAEVFVSDDEYEHYLVY